MLIDKKFEQKVEQIFQQTKKRFFEEVRQRVEELDTDQSADAAPIVALITKAQAAGQKASQAETRAAIKKTQVEAEVVAINPKTKEYLPFQQLMHRRRKHGIEKAIKQYPISLNFFDVLYCDNKEIMNENYSNRRRILEGIVKVDEVVKVVPSKISDNPEEIYTHIYKAVIKAAKGDDNLMPHFINAVKAKATLGELCDALREVFGEYREPSEF